MSQGKTDSVDLTKDEDSSKSKKMKQMRLPFAKIDKNVALAKMEAEVQKKAEELSKKRKLSVSSTEEEATIMDAAEGTPNATGIVKVGSSKKKARQSSSPRKRSISQENTTIKKLAKKDDADDIEIIEVKKVEVSSPNEPPMMTDSLIKTPESKAKKINKPRSKAKKATPESKATKAVGGTLMKSPEPVAKAMDALIKTPEPVSKLKDSTLKTPDPTPGSSEKVKTLTPKQLARKAMFDKQREEKERQKEDARLAREAEKTKRDAEKKEMEAQKKAEIQEREKERLKKKKQKDEMEAQKKAEFHEREKERLQKKKQKDEQKETERKEREEAAKKKQEEKEEKERAEKAKSEKSKLSFSKFFVKGQKEAETKAVPKPVCNNGLNQFRIKVNMKLAPLVRVNDRDSKKSLLDCSLNTDVVKEAGLYLSGLKRDQYKAGRQGKTWPYSVKKADDDDDDIEIIEEDEEDLIGDEIQDEQDKASPKAIGRVFTKAKLLQFHDNQRPAYFGTWNKKTSKVSPRRPFGMDSEIFDYEYDSDDDWEEEEQGESLSDEEKDKEEDEVEEQNDKDDEDDDGFFVGHGVLDKDELKAAEDEEDAFDEELEIKKQKLKAQQFEEEYKKKKPIKLKPRVFGCFWNDIIKEEKDNELRIAYDQLIKILTPFKAVVLTTNRDEPIQTSVSKPGQDQEQGDSPNSQTDKAAKSLKTFPEDAISDLVRLVHANTNNKIFLSKEFTQFWMKRGTTPEGNNIPKTKVLAKIAEIAVYQRSETLGRKCWMVKEDVLQKCGLGEPEVPNRWSYILEQPNKSMTPTSTPVVSTKSTPAKKEKTAANDAMETPKTAAAEKALMRPSPASLITKFTKVLSEEERLKAMKDSAERAKVAKEVAEKAKVAKEASDKAKVIKDAADKAKLAKEALVKAKVTSTQPVVSILTPKRKIQPTLIDLSKEASDKAKVTNDLADKAKLAKVALVKAKVSSNIEVSVTPKRKIQPTLVDLTKQ